MPDSASSRDLFTNKLFTRLLVAIGKNDALDAERDRFVHWFRLLRVDVMACKSRYESGEAYPELLRALYANCVERRKLRARFEPFEYELYVIKLKWLRANGIEGARRVSMMQLTNPGFTKQLEWCEEETIRIALDTADDYRKGALRRLAIEPFLVMLRDEGVIAEDMTSSRELPLTRMVDALLNWLGLDPRLHPRPSKSGLETIIRETRRDFPRETLP